MLRKKKSSMGVEFVEGRLKKDRGKISLKSPWGGGEGKI